MGISEMATGKNGALSLLKNYGSESEGDSGYTSEEEKKRKNEYRSPHEHRKKRRKADEEEEMMVDNPPSASLPRRRKQQCLQKKNSGDEDGKNTNEAEQMMEIAPNHPKNNSLIPLPSEFLEDRNAHIDDPNQHQGRVRSFAHERGNWASIVFIPLHLGVYKASFSSFLASLVAVCQDQNLNLQTSTDLHISLSRTLILYLHWIQPLKDYFNQRLRLVPKFSLWLHGLSVYLNDEKTRTFLGLRVCQGRSELSEIITEVDAGIAEYRLPPFYKDGSFHTSIAWCNGDVSQSLQALLPQLENMCNEYFNVESDMRTFDVDLIKFKTGNRIHTIHLKDSF